MSKPWEDYKKMKESSKKAPVKEQEESSPWEDYQKNMAGQQQRDRELGPQIVERAPDLALLGAQGATLGFLDEGAGALEHLQGGDYTEARDEARGKISDARGRQGLWGDVAEMGGSMVTSVAVPALRGGSFIKELGLAALQGAGEADEMEDVPGQALKSGLMSAGSQAVVKGAAHKMFGEPSKILANTSGARGINYDKAGDIVDKKPDEIAKRLDSIGFFKMGDRRFDPNTKSFILNSGPGGQGKLEAAIKPASLDTYMERVEKANQALGQQNAQLLRGKRIPINEVDDVLIDTAFDFIPEGSGVADRAKAAVDIVQEIVSDLRSRGAIRNGRIEAAEIQKVKQFLQHKVHKSYQNQGLSDITNDGLEGRRTYATKLDQLLDKYGGAEYAKNNDLMRDLFSQKEFLHKKSARMSGESISGAKLVRPTLMDHAADVLDNPMVGVGRARVGQALETGTGKASMDAITRLPVEVINNREQSPGGNWRKPQSTPNIPEELIRTPLPRTTKGLMDNKVFVLAKIAQMAPDMLEAVKDTYAHDPEMLGQLAPVIAQRMPHFFERDKYNRFDGRIMNEADKQKAIKDTLGDTRLSTIEQAKIITRLNKEGLYER